MSGSKLDIRRPGLGDLAPLSDELLLSILQLLPARELSRLGCVSKAAYCFVHQEELWKALLLEGFGGDWEWRGGWRETYLVATQPRYQPGSHVPLRVQGFYSDLLYQPWLCATVPINPEWLQRDNIDRRSNLSVEEFRRLYEVPNRPVVITDVVPTWPAFRTWNRDYLAAALAGTQPLVGNMPVRLKSYWEYCNSNRDELPLYLFDKCAFDAAPCLAQDFQVPPYFQEDLFALLGDEGRPDYRWLIMGPTRSGSTFHQDPNATSAWNAVITGSKRWLLYPPHVAPPGVHPSADGADVAAPVSIIEWFLNFYEAACEGKVTPVECTVRAGELLFVPRGWWHMALNLEETIAITQNYVSTANLGPVLDFLRKGTEATVSGCARGDRAQLYPRFLRALQRHRPDTLAVLEAAQAARAAARQQAARLSALFKPQAAVSAAPAAVSGVQISATPSTAASGAHGGRAGLAAGVVQAAGGGAVLPLLKVSEYEQQECRQRRRMRPREESDSGGSGCGSGGGGGSGGSGGAEAATWQLRREGTPPPAKVPRRERPPTPTPPGTPRCGQASPIMLAGGAGRAATTPPASPKAPASPALGARRGGCGLRELVLQRLAQQAQQQQGAGGGMDGLGDSGGSGFPRAVEAASGAEAGCSDGAASGAGGTAAPRPRQLRHSGDASFGGWLDPVGDGAGRGGAAAAAAAAVAEAALAEAALAEEALAEVSAVAAGAVVEAPAAAAPAAELAAQQVPSPGFAFNFQL